MTNTGLLVLVGLLSMVFIVAAAYAGYWDNSERKVDHALTWFTIGGALVMALRIFVVLNQHLCWWAYYSFDYLQGMPVMIFVMYLSNEPLLFPGGWRLATFTLEVAILVAAVLVLGGLVIWPLWLFCWVIHWFMHRSS